MYFVPVKLQQMVTILQQVLPEPESVRYLVMVKFLGNEFFWMNVTFWVGCIYYIISLYIWNQKYSSLVQINQDLAKAKENKRNSVLLFLPSIIIVLMFLFFR